MSCPPSKIAVVTGAARRIGRVIALFLAEHGWDVAVHYRFSEQDAMQTVQDIRKLGRRAVALRCDLTDEDAVNGLLKRVQQALGTPSCLVNNASVFEHDSVTDFSAHSLDFHMRTNLTAPVLLSRALYAMTPEGEQSVVINLLDQKLDNLNPSFLSYTLSKAALNTATTLLAQELAPKLRVVGIAPGITLVSGEQTEQDFQIATFRMQSFSVIEEAEGVEGREGETGPLSARRPVSVSARHALSGGVPPARPAAIRSANRSGASSVMTPT